MLPRKLRRPISAAKPTGTKCSQTSGNSPCQCHVRGTVIKLVAGRGHIRSYRSPFRSYRSLSAVLIFAEYSLGSRSLTLKVTLDGSRCSSSKCLEHFLT